MLSPSRSALLALCLLSTACGSRTSPTTPATTSTRATPAAVLDAVPADPSVQQVRVMLQARHTDDLPDRSSLDAVPDALAALRVLAETDELMVTRARALSLIGLYDQPTTTAYLLDVVSDDSAHGKLRAAAMQGLGRTALSVHPEARAALEALTRSDDLRLATEAVTALQGVPESAELLSALKDDATVPSAVRDAAGM
jgi:hypothetical protein